MLLLTTVLATMATASVEPTGAVESALTSIAATVLPSAVTTTAPVTAGVVAVPLPMELAAVFAGAVIGGLAAVDHDLDILGLATMAVTVGLGGGMIRDVLLSQPLAAFANTSFLVTALVAAALVFAFTGIVGRLKPMLFAIDALSLGLFAIVGADKALRAGLPLLPAIMCGTVTAVGGGMLKDIFLGDVPKLFKPGTLYGLAAVASATLFTLLVEYAHITKGWAGLVAVVLAVAVRGLAVWLKWETRPAAEFSPWLHSSVRRVAKRNPGDPS